VTTALIAVLAAVCSLLAGNWADDALLHKNEAVLAESQAADQYSYYQAKGLKKALADFAFAQTKDPALQAESDKEAKKQADAQTTAEGFVKMVEEENLASLALEHKHSHGALGVTLFQIAIALSAMAALLHRKSFWALSVLLAGAGSAFLGWGIHG
jgi:hypothetical protein